MESDSSDDYEDKEVSNILNKMTYNDDIDMLGKMRAQTLEALNDLGDLRLKLNDSLPNPTEPSEKKDKFPTLSALFKEPVKNLKYLGLPLKIPDVRDGFKAINCPVVKIINNHSSDQLRQSMKFPKMIEMKELNVQINHLYQH